MKELIDLQSAHITQFTTKDGKGAWKVRKNITSEDLFELPGELTENQVFEIIRFAREFELKAFNVGIQFGKDINKNNIKIAQDENIRLASTIDKLTREEK